MRLENPVPSHTRKEESRRPDGARFALTACLQPAAQHSPSQPGGEGGGTRNREKTEKEREISRN